MNNPLRSPNKLAGNPKGPLHFAKSITTNSGKKLDVADPRSTRALVALMDMYAVLGGAASHYGGPAAFAELMSGLHALVFDEAKSASKQWYDLFHIVNDAGHCENGLYALKANYEMAGLKLDSLKQFRSIKSPLTGHGEVHCFPSGVFLSNGPLGSALPQTQGLAMAEALTGGQRVTISIVSDGASMEGEAKEAFAAIPGLAALGKLGPYVMIISDNNTKLSGRIDKESFSMNPSFESLKTLGWNVIEVAKGNDLVACASAIEEAIKLARQNPKQAIAIHAKTLKGIGTKKTAESASGGHGFPLKSPTELPAFISEIYDGEKYPELFDLWIQDLIKVEEKIKASGIKDSGEKIQTGVSAALIRARKEGLPIVSVTSDLPGSTGVAGFRKEFPEASFDVGVAESNMISAAIGMSKMGYIPVVDTFAQFGVTKGALPLMMASLSEAPVIAIFSHTGFQDAADGASHQALSYMAKLGSIPHLETYQLSCSDEADALVYQAAQKMAEQKRTGSALTSYVFFLGRENFPKTYGALAYKLGRAQILKDNHFKFARSVAIISSGSLIPQALRAAEVLEQQGIGAMLINHSPCNHADIALLDEVLNKVDFKVVTVEDHQIVGGLGQFLVHQMVLEGMPLHLKSLGVHGEFGQSSYTAQELYAKHEIDSLAIVKAAHELLD